VHGGFVALLRSEADAWIPHVLPFVGWIFVMQMLGDPEGWKYGARILVGGGLLLALRPWRYYKKPKWRNIPWGVAVGVAVFVMWVVPEWAGFGGDWARHYRTFGMQMPWKETVIEHVPIYVGLWALVRIAGSAVVIPVIEEFFWRGFFYRWVARPEFMKVDHGKLVWWALLVSALFFASVHTRWLVAVPCGIAYGLLYINTRDIWAAVWAHAVTNLLLGLYVLKTGQHGFW